MLKKLLIPFFVISVAAVASNGCGSSSGGGGTAGKAGTAGAGGGTAGAGTAGSGTAGSGTAGSGTAGSGTAGSGTAGSGTAGAAAGTDGGSAGAGTDAGTAGAGTDAGTAGAGTDGGSDASDSGGAPNVASLEAVDCPAKRTAMNAATPFSATDFCANLDENVCGAQTFTDALTADDCVAMYTAWASKKVNGQPTVGVQNCTSYHLCNAVTMSAATHCPHAAATVASATCNPAN